MVTRMACIAVPSAVFASPGAALIITHDGPEEKPRAEAGRLTGVAAAATFGAGCREVWQEALRGWNMIQSKVVEGWQAEGRAEMVLEQLVEKFGPVPSELAAAIRGQTDLATLKRWGSLVLRA